MVKDQHIWQNWADRLHRWGMQDLVAALLEATGPLNLLGAQVVYLGQPLLNQFLPDNHLDALANLLENPKETQAFTNFLRQKNVQNQSS